MHLKRVEIKSPSFRSREGQGVHERKRRKRRKRRKKKEGKRKAVRRDGD